MCRWFLRTYIEPKYRSARSISGHVPNGLYEGDGIEELGIEPKIAYEIKDDHDIYYFAYGWDFSENGLATAKDMQTKLWGYIDNNVEWVIEPKFAYTQEFSLDGIAIAQDFQSELWGIITEKGEWLCEPKFIYLNRFSDNGLAAAKDKTTELWGFISRTGEWVIEPKFDIAQDFKKGIVGSRYFAQVVNYDRATLAFENFYIAEDGVKHQYPLS